MTTEPASFTALVARGGELGGRAEKLLARIEWPGKPGAAAPVTPLTPDEQKRFAAGQEVYRNVCQACHQPDGRGMEKLAPPLVGSAYALASPTVPVRILLNGKEGSIGLMPPVGQIFTDEQIAAVLTYVRREWGQRGDPVDPATVGSVRAATKGPDASVDRWRADAVIASPTQSGRSVDPMLIAGSESESDALIGESEPSAVRQVARFQWDQD